MGVMSGVIKFLLIKWDDRAILKMYSVWMYKNPTFQCPPQLPQKHTHIHARNTSKTFTAIWIWIDPGSVWDAL